MPSEKNRDPALLCGFIKSDGKGCQNFKTKTANGGRLDHCHLASHQPGYVKPQSAPKSKTAATNSKTATTKSKAAKKGRWEAPANGRIFRADVDALMANYEQDQRLGPVQRVTRTRAGALTNWR